MIQGNYNLRNFEHSVLTLLTYKYASFNKFKTLGLNISGNCSLDSLHETWCRPLPRNFLHPPSLVCCLKNVLLSYFACYILYQCLKDTCFVFFWTFSLQHYLRFYLLALDTHIFEDSALVTVYFVVRWYLPCLLRLLFWGWQLLDLACAILSWTWNCSRTLYSDWV